MIPLVIVFHHFTVVLAFWGYIRSVKIAVVS